MRDAHLYDRATPLDMTPEEFGTLSEKNWDRQKAKRNEQNILAYHSVCPHCVGQYQHAVQAERIAKRTDHFERHGR